MSMAHSIEVRPPFLDERIVAFASRLPERLKISGAGTKLVLRELMKDKLPPSILVRKKVGFDIPAHEWFRGVLKPFLLDTINESTVRESGIFEWWGIKQIIESHMQRRANLGYHLWGLMTLLLWMKKWNIQVQAMESEKTSVDLEQIMA